MAQTLTNRLGLIKNTPGTGELTLISELNAGFDEIDTSFIPAAKMRQTPGQSPVTGVVTTMTFDTVEYDSYVGRPEGAMADLATETITIRKTGLYLILAKVGWVANVAGFRRIAIAKNGTEIVGGVNVPSSSGNITMVDSTLLVPCTAGDLITAKIFQSSGAGLATSNNTFVDNCSLAVAWFGSIV